MSKNQLLILGSVLGLVFAAVRFWSVLHVEPAFVPYEDRMGRELANLVIETASPGKVVVLLPDFEGITSPIQEARYDGLVAGLAKAGKGWAPETQLVKTDPMMAQAGGDVFSAKTFLSVVDAHADAVAIVSLVGPPAGQRTLVKAWKEREALPAVVIMAVYDEPLGPLLKSGVIDGIIAPRHRSGKDIGLDAFDDPYEARFHLEYEVRRGRKASGERGGDARS